MVKVETVTPEPVSKFSHASTPFTASFQHGQISVFVKEPGSGGHTYSTSELRAMAEVFTAAAVACERAQGPKTTVLTPDPVVTKPVSTGTA